MNGGQGDTYDQRRSWSDRFIPEQLRILAGLTGHSADAFRITETAEDIGGTDIIGPDGIRIGLRVRRKHILTNHPNDMAVRMTRDRRGISELNKLKAGVPDFTLYTYADTSVVAWRWLDLNVFRRAGEHWFSGVGMTRLDIEGKNFMAFDLNSFAPYGRIVLASDGV